MTDPTREKVDENLRRLTASVERRAMTELEPVAWMWEDRTGAVWLCGDREDAPEAAAVVGAVAVRLVTLSSAQSALEERDKRIAELTQQRDAWTDNDRAKAWRQSFDDMHQRAMTAEARADELTKKVMTVLRPFSDCAQEWDGEEDALHVFLEWKDDTPAQSLPVADFRAARAISDKIGGKDV